VVATARILRRVWQIYVAHVFLFTIFLAKSPTSPPVSRTRSTARKWASWISSSSRCHHHPGAAAAIPPVNMDVLPLYIVLMLFLPLILWLMKWRPTSRWRSRCCSTR
jgi:hypothetical protein